MTILDDSVADFDPGAPDRVHRTLLPEHVSELATSGIPLDVATAQGVYSATRADELPSWAQWIVSVHGDATLPALVYPMVQADCDRTVTGQVKPVAGSVVFDDGRAPKYISPASGDNPPRLVVLREVDTPSRVLIVEGVKQALAVLAWAPSDVSIYRITGIHSWLVSSGVDGVPGAPTDMLSLVLGHKVVVIPDADAATNINVFDGAAALGQACVGFGATSVAFARIPGAGKDGIDDVLGRVSDPDQRRALLASWVGNAKSRPADLDKREQSQMRAALVKATRTAAVEDEFEGRVGVDVGGDPLSGTAELLGTFAARRGGDTIFHMNNGIVRLRRSTGGSLRSEALDASGLHRELLDVACPYTETRSGLVRVPVSPAMLGLVADHWDELPPLTGITQSPCVRGDGTINTSAGYDPATGQYLDLSDDVQGIDVPDNPTDADLAAAVSLLRDDLFAMDGFGGYDSWVFKDVSDQTNAVAFLLTPLVIAAVGPTPLFLLNGIQPGVGKGALAEACHRVPFGISAPLQPTPSTDEEMDKRITAQLSEGAPTIFLDEVQDETGHCRLKSASLRTALTVRSYRGRVLSRTKMLDLPNMATWAALGNSVQIPADMARRVVPIRLDSDRTDLENRNNFRHSLSTWVPENRAALLRACLVLIRAWYARNQPEAPTSFGFASFEEWQRVIGGILHLAGFKGFLENVMDERRNSDSEDIDNREHWDWVASQFPAGTRFSASQVLVKSNAPDSPPPYGKRWDELDARSLSTYYGGHRKWYGDKRIREDGKMHGSGKAYVVEYAGVVGAAASTTPTPTPPAPAAAPAAPATGGGIHRDEVVRVTDRHGRAHNVSRVAPSMDAPTIADLAGGAS